MAVTYANGFVPASALAPLDGQPGCFLRADAAAAWNAARADVLRRTGIVLTVRGWNRTYTEQVLFYLQRHRLARAGDRVCCYWGGRGYTFTGTAHASPPGHSNHGWGIAVDVNDYGNVGNFSHPRRVATFPILAEYGWTDTEGRGSIREPWHLVYSPAHDTHTVSNPIGGGGGVTLPDPPSSPNSPDPIQETDPMSTPEVLAAIAETNAKLDNLISRTDVLVEIVGVPNVEGDRSKGQAFFLVNWSASTKRGIPPTQFAYLQARGQLDVVEWQPTGTLNNLTQI